MNRPFLSAMLGALLLIALPVAAQDAGTATKQALSDAYTGKAYSPYAGRNLSLIHI